MPQSLLDILTSQLKIREDAVTPASSLTRDLGADSLDLLQLLMALEEKFEITIPDEALAGFETVQDVMDFLSAQNIAL